MRFLRGLPWLLVTMAVLVGACAPAAPAPAAAPTTAPAAKPTTAPAAAPSAPPAIAASPAAATSASPAAAVPSPSAAAASNSAPAAPGSLGKITLGLAVAQTFEFLPAYAAQDMGTWKKRGLDVEIVGFPGGAPLEQAMAANSVDVGANAATTLAAIDKGLDARIVAAISNKISLMGLGVAPSINSKEDLKGKTIGVTSPNAPTDILVRLLSKDVTGNAESGITRARLGGYDAQVAALKTGQTQGFVWTLEGIFLAEKQGTAKYMFSFGDVVGDFAFEQLVARKQIIDQRPDALRAFLQGWYEGQDRIKSDQAYAASLWVKEMGGDEDIGKRVWETDAKILEPKGALDDKALNGTAQALVDAGVLSSVPPLDNWVDKRFAPVQ